MVKLDLKTVVEGILRIWNMMLVQYGLLPLNYLRPQFTKLPLLWSFGLTSPPPQFRVVLGIIRGTKSIHGPASRYRRRQKPQEKDNVRDTNTATIMLSSNPCRYITPTRLCEMIDGRWQTKILKGMQKADWVRNRQMVDWQKANSLPFANSAEAVPAMW